MPENTQTRSRLLARAESFVRARLEANACGHDFHHIHRVRVLALRIAPEVGADPFLVEMGALLHDVADPKLNATPEAGRRVLEEFLSGCDLAPDTRARLKDIL
ncbi:MAG: HD domain-containing protein, partial [Fibrobacteria bacterium]